MKKILLFLIVGLIFITGCITTNDIGESINYKCDSKSVQQTIDKGKTNVTNLGYKVIAVRTKMIGINEYLVTIFFDKNCDNCNDCQDCKINDVKKTNLKK